MSFDQQVEYESFLMTNMMPQLGGLNRGIWKLLETTIRGWVVQRQQSYTIYAGPIYSAGDPTIGANRVTVPHAFYKIVINTTTGETLGWVFPQAVNLGNDLTRFRAPISNIQQQTGLRFGFPGNVREIPPGTEWPVDFGRLTNAKRSRCGRASE
jgi:endonuclease G